MAIVSSKIELELLGRGNGWTDISVDVLSPLSLSYGITGGGPSDRVASSGTCTFSLNNSDSNSAGIAGYYSSGSSVARGGWTLGIRVRVSLHDPATTTWHVRFVGSISTISPIAGVRGARTVAVTAVDWFDDAARSRIDGIATQINKRSDEIISLLIANVSHSPESESLAVGASTFAYALDTAREGAPVLQEIARVVNSELGYLYQRGDGTVTFEARGQRISTDDAYTFDNTMSGLSFTSDRAHVLSDVRTTIYPRTVDASLVVLYALTSATQIAAGQTVTIQGGYTDPSNRAVRVGGKDLAALVSVTDYTANSLADGSGTDYTSSISVTANTSSNAVTFSVTNSASVAIFITKLQIRGKGIYDYQPITATAHDAAVALSFGDSVSALDMPYQNSFSVGSDAASYLLSLYGTRTIGVWHLGTSGSSNLGVSTQLSYEVQRSVGDVSVSPTTAALQTQILVRDVGDRIALTESMTGLSAIDYYIQAVELTIQSPGIPFVTWTLAPADTTAYWRLDTVNFSELGSNTYLSYS